MVAIARRWARVGVLVALLCFVSSAGLVIYLLLHTGGRAGVATTLSGSAPSAATGALATPFPRLWSDALTASPHADAELIACRDRNADNRLNGADSEDLAGLDIQLDANACAANYGRADLLVLPPTDATKFVCAGSASPLLIIGIASAGSTLRDSTEGESTGLITMINELQTRAARAGLASQVIVAAPAIFGAVPPQTSMEQWVAHDLRQRLDALPCLRAVLIGHSHGGVTVTSVTAMLDTGYSDRMFGVPIDRTTALYDRVATEMPSRTPILNVFQLNEGWHGEPIDQPNVVNDDESTERAPVALSDGGGGLALVSHKTLDDSTGVQARVEDAVMGWVARSAVNSSGPRTR